jgi:SIR2-like domain
MQELKERIQNGTVMLFVGAGVSKSLGLPDYQELIGHIAEELGYDPQIFATYGDYLTLGEYYLREKGSIGSLRSWMDRTWHNDGIDIAKSKIHELIVDINCSIIYTTNYDRWLERAFDHYDKKKYVRISDASDLKLIQNGLTQIVKFHGDFDDDNSIVLTESSYFDRLNFESPLDIKLRADMLNRSVLFIGYSLTDINMRYLFYRFEKLWDNLQRDNDKPKSYIFLSRPNPVLETVLKHRGIETIHSEEDDPTEGLRVFLEELCTTET